ncbi:MAG TPA: MFS transporter [Sphingomonas sp.]|jgi:EmrB/QacA subfamily drug resistance transporter|uniref:MFS transporter n=1 Tax=Sphingomonas sp. TaxID=28214 RepID=UPI002ED9D285
MATAPAPGRPIARELAAALDPRARTLAFVTLTIAFVMELVDGTIVNIAIPSIRADLGASPTAVQWMVAGYAVAFAMLLVTGGRLGDMIGYRTMFVGGMAGFTITSVMCGMAATPTQLVLARLLQGATAACMGPQVMALVQLLYPPQERIKALSLFGVLGGLSAVLGPIVGGALIDADIAGLGWRSIFLINVPIGVAGIVAGRALLPRGASPDAIRIDWIGNAVLILLMFSLILPMVEGRELGWPWWIFALLALALPLAALLHGHLKRRMARAGSALLDPAMFRERSFANGLLTSTVFATAGGGLLIVLTLLLQVGLSLDPFVAGLVHVPFAVGVGLGVGLLGRRVLPRLGRSVLAAGATAMAVGVLGLWWAVANDAGLVAIGIALLVAGLGMGTCAGPLSPIALSRVDTRHAGAAGAALGTVQQLGSAIGAASIGALFFATAHGATEATPTRAAFGPAALSICLLLCIVIVLSRRFPVRLFDGPTARD